MSWGIPSGSQGDRAKDRTGDSLQDMYPVGHGTRYLADRAADS